MKVLARRSGGFAGLSEDVADVDTSRLKVDAAQQVEQMVHGVGFFELPDTLPGAIGADLFRYEITVADGERRHTVAFVDDDSPQTAPLRRLVEVLAGIA
ncbi:MAG: hypothetical protein Q8R28_22630 [Dehalococcoidia bacterium]|nr:hypothetical protein [Dehalococcoidia bacterium]